MVLAICLAQCMFIAQMRWQLSAVVMVYRAYAFTGHKPTMLIFLGSCYLALIRIGLWAFSTAPAAVSDMLFGLIGNVGSFPKYNDPLMQPQTVVKSAYNGEPIPHSTKRKKKKVSMNIRIATVRRCGGGPCFPFFSFSSYVPTSVIHIPSALKR